MPVGSNTLRPFRISYGAFADVNALLGTFPEECLLAAAIKEVVFRCFWRAEKASDKWNFKAASGVEIAIQPR